MGTAGALRIVPLRKDRVEAQPPLHSEPQGGFAGACSHHTELETLLTEHLQNVVYTSSTPTGGLLGSLFQFESFPIVDKSYVKFCLWGGLTATQANLGVLFEKVSCAMCPSAPALAMSGLCCCPILAC